MFTVSSLTAVFGILSGVLGRWGGEGGGGGGDLTAPEMPEKFCCVLLC